MMIANPTAASAAATVITKNTNTCPPMPYACANATNVRLTAFSMSSTHMNTMIALRRIKTPNTPIVNSTAEKNSASASMLLPFSALFAEDDGTDHCREQQHARHLEGQQVFVEQRTGNRGDRAALGNLPRGESLRQREIDRRLGPREREDLGEDPERHRARRELPSQS